jgi:hypothetical protein
MITKYSDLIVAKDATEIQQNRETKSTVIPCGSRDDGAFKWYNLR